MLRRDHAELREALAGWGFEKVVDGELVPWPAGEWLDLPIHEVHGRPDTSSSPVEFLLDEADGDDWVLRRAPRIRRPLTQVFRAVPAGLRLLAPEVVLLYKSQAPREADEHDFAVARELMDAEARAWLREAIACRKPRHRWVTALAARPSSEPVGKECMEEPVPPTPATIALFVLANAHIEEGDEPPSRVRLREGGPVVSMDEAAAYLDSLPKPIGLEANVRDGVLTLRRDDQLTEFAQILLPNRMADDGFGFVRERYGPFIADLELVCFSRGGCLRVRLADFRQFQREYFLGTAGNRGMDFTDSRYPIAQGARRSDVAGAALFVSFR